MGENIENLFSKKDDAAQKVKTGTEQANPLLKPSKIFRIAVSGDVTVTRLEREIIDTLDFQRLRGIRQLGNVMLVYPCALHTRFDHSLGTLYMASQMIESIQNNAHSTEDERNIDDNQVILTRLYALLHDITHVSFGHTIEDELGLIPRHDQNAKRILQFIGPQSEIGKIIIKTLGQDMYDRFMSIYLWDDGEQRSDKMTEMRNKWPEQVNY